MTVSKIKNCFELLSMVTYADKLKSMIKKEFHMTFEEFAVLTHLSHKIESEYFLKDIINNLNYKQPQVVKAVKNLSQDGYFNKRRNEHDERTVLILVDDEQRQKINALLEQINLKIKESNIRPN
ncbi:global transcriptional regulator SarA [Staphylococcus americanisciuri]|uniref:Global transcriptional regulator SarA n=1 Tax=Staphylococcus americanisciuri TaxID=2973940 RepID=A0ABT2F3R1_9STAP|nr:global transcriptional regulator SarA [Staphylococcus americanisciuri]MCS4486510.1 global transcriptional regulator SarA [Staphylococcus americanisciuri]